MNLLLKDQIVIISGAGRGLGAAVAAAVAREGAKVAINYRASRERAEILAAQHGDHAADAVLFFASPWARAVTGQNLIVDGGLACG